jgi:drug/metabolite transporter (DMT)-like permease
LNAVRLWLFFEAFRRTSIGNAIIVLYSWPVFAMIYGTFLLDEKLNPRDLILVFLAITGVTIVYSGGKISLQNDDFVGMSLMLISAVIYALVLVLIKREKVERLKATFWQNLVGAVVFLPFFLISVRGMAADSWIWAGLNGLVVGTLAFTLFFSALNRLPAALVGHIAYLEVVFGLLWGAVIFFEPVNLRHIAGGGLIVLSMLIRAELRRRRSE